MVFVGGLHRSGTSLMTELVASHPQASRLRATGVPEDEGQHLQDVYATAMRLGGPGRFAFSPRAHLTEPTIEDARDAGSRLLASWRPYWDLSKPVLVEKSPSNMLMSRFLQSVFPGSSFIMMIRHPIAVAGATRKWTRRTYSSLVAHWLKAYDTMIGDLPYIERGIVVRYEDLVLRPEWTMRGIYSFLHLDQIEVPDKNLVRGINDRYFLEWERSGILPDLVRRMVTRRFGERVRQLSYDVNDREPVGRLPRELSVSEWVP
jgi:hypothetical protein